jgi:hypothetical protein
MEGALYHLSNIRLAIIWLAIVNLFQGGYRLYDLVINCVIEHHEAIFDDLVLDGLPRSLPSLLSGDDY